MTTTPEDTQHEQLLSAPLDLRLVPAALLSWLVSILGLMAGWVPAAVATGGAGVLALCSVLSRGRPVAHGVLATAGCVAAVGLVVTAGTYQVVEHPLRRAAMRAAGATVRVVLTSDPAPILNAASTGFAGRPAGATTMSVAADLIEAQSDGQRWRLGGRIVLLTPVRDWTGLLPGTELTASGRLAPALRPDLTVAVLRVRGPPSRVVQPPVWQRGAGALRAGLRAASAVLPQRSAQLLPGMVDGDTAAMSWSLREEFRRTGLTHLVAVSGTNVVIVVGAVVGLLALCRAGPRLTTALALLALLGFVILARPSPSVLRAAVMGGVGLLALLAGRRRAVLPALAASVIGLLLIDPALGTDPGFALSVLATAALVLLAPGWVTRLRMLGCPPGVAEALAAPVAAHLVTAPVIAGLSGQVSLVAVLANLLAAPVVAPVTVLGVLAAMLSPISLELARWCARLAGPAVGWLVGVAHWGAGIPDGAVSWPSGPAGAFALVLVLLAGWALLRRRRFRVMALAALLGALLVLVPTRFLRPGWPVPGWAMVACDVGQGDSLVLSTGVSGSAVLVDTGTAADQVDGCLTRLGVRALSLVVLTHMHADHIGGLAAALAGRSVGAVAVGPIHLPGWAFASVRRTAAEHAAPIVELRAGQLLRWPALTLRVIGPTDPTDEIDPEDGDDINNSSLIMRADTSAGSVLLAGDAEVLSQSQLLDSGADVHADILKMPHHGSRYSSTDFLTAVHPRLVLVSVGAGNPYGHPNEGVLRLLRDAGALVLRTDQSGDIAVIPAGGSPAAVARGDPLPAPHRH